MSVERVSVKKNYNGRILGLTVLSVTLEIVRIVITQWNGTVRAGRGFRLFGVVRDVGQIEPLSNELPIVDQILLRLLHFLL